ncbi:MAG: hypothetical protein COA93_11365 [Alphaproteobacteria bacterium]|nr:MAG: hypothetical protein COA93_11365 [Alphaproteobacteria bacterium]
MLSPNEKILDLKLTFLSNLIANLLFLFFNLGIFYAMYWAYKVDLKIEKETKPKQQNLNRN